MAWRHYRPSCLVSPVIGLVGDDWSIYGDVEYFMDPGWKCNNESTRVALVLEAHAASPPISLFLNRGKIAGRHT